ncbi:MAG: ThuA domain-containing protein [Caulobacterales bacterium]|nr:ThuA domain-containing protein [Caulobacterales bacterium]
MSEEMKKRINAVFVVGGDWHDFDFARLEILKLLAEDERIRTRVFEDYDSARPALAGADFLVSYTCNVLCSVETQEALKAFVAGGKRWYALHGTNSVLRFLSPEGASYGQLLVDAPRWAPLFMETLGSQFLAHPPIAPYRVEVTQPSHPLVEGVQPFETTDELYLMETHGDLDVMLHCEFEGEATGFVEKDWAKARHPVFYAKSHGEGRVLYLTLGHCRGHYDMVGVTDYYPEVERCAWELPVFHTLLRRGLAWAKEPALTPAVPNGG